MGWTRQEVLDVARSTGRPVVEAWSDHDAGQMGTVLGPMLHHTGSGWSYPRLTAPTLRVVRDGRAGLENALSMYYIDYEGVIYCITEKIAWHAGYGSWQGVTDGNGHFAGIEAESDGVQWTKPTVASYKHLAAAILRKTGRTAAYAPRHADYALPKGRKTDFSGMDPAGFLADVNSELAGNPSEEDEMTPEQARQLQAVHDWIRDDKNLDVNILQRILPAALDAQYRVRGNHPDLDTLQVIQWQIAQLAAGQATQRPDVDEKALAEQITGALIPAVVAAVGKQGGLTAEQITEATEKAVREVFADAGS